MKNVKHGTTITELVAVCSLSSVCLYKCDQMRGSGTSQQHLMAFVQQEVGNPQYALYVYLESFLEQFRGSGTSLL